MATQSSIIGLAHENFPAFLRQRERAENLDPWAFGQQTRDELFIPAGQQASREYIDLGERSSNPWGMLIITSVVQTIFLDGVRMPGTQKNLDSWRAWQENDFDEKQIPLYRAAMSHGAAYVIAANSRNRLTKKESVLWKPRSAKRVACFWDEDDTEWPVLALDAKPQKLDKDGSTVDGWLVDLYDDDYVHHLAVSSFNGLDIKDWVYIKSDPHGFGVPPVVEYPNISDVDGATMGELEPLLPLLRRIDQDTFDRLIVQRFGAWKVRYITGLVRPQGMSEAQYRAALKELKVGDFLVTDSDKSKVGQLDEMDLERLIKAADSDLRTLSAVSQTPPHHMLGLSSNLQAESLAAAEAGLQRKSFDRKTVFGTRHERLMRLTAKGLGNKAEMRAVDMKVRWRDMESRSLSQAADALGKLATQVGVPQPMLFEMIPHWDDSDVERATELVKSGAIDKLLEEMQAHIAKQQGQLDANPQPVGAGA